MIGILAYGSLIADPGWEIIDQTDSMIHPVETPFPVEYARRSKTRANAPTLVPVPFGKGVPVQATVIVLKKEILLQQAKDILYRREIHRICDTKKVYREPDSQDSNKMRIVLLNNFAGVNTVLYTKLATNFQPILDDEYNDHQKSDLLCAAACESLTEETFHSCQDGIHYLNAAIHSGVKTRLTELYAQAILKVAGNNVVELALARAIIAKSKGL
jgi:hypothetical protein